MELFLLELTGRTEKREAKDFCDHADLIILDGCDEAATYGPELESQIRELAGAGFVVPTQSEEPSIPVDLSDTVEWNQNSRELVVSESLSVFDFKRLLDHNRDTAFHSQLELEINRAITARPRIVLTTRTDAEIQLPRSFQKVQLKPMNDAQIETFFTKWFHASPSKASDVLSFLRGNAHVKDVCRTPLVATIIASLAERGMKLPQTRTEIYTKRFDLLLEQWDSVKRVTREMLLSPDEKKHFLSTLALALHKRHLRVFQRSDAEKLWKKRYAHSFPGVEFDELLAELVVANGVVISEGGESYSLGHLSYQEYLAALGVMYSQSNSLLVDNTAVPWWRRVLVFYVGLTMNAGKIIRGMLTKHGLPENDSFVQELVLEARLSPANVTDFLREMRRESGARNQSYDDDFGD